MPAEDIEFSIKVEGDDLATGSLAKVQKAADETDKKADKLKKNLQDIFAGQIIGEGGGRAAQALAEMGNAGNDAAGKLSGVVGVVASLAGSFAAGGETGLAIAAGTGLVQAGARAWTIQKEAALNAQERIREETERSNTILSQYSHAIEQDEIATRRLAIQISTGLTPAMAALREESDRLHHYQEATTKSAAEAKKEYDAATGKVQAYKDQILHAQAGMNMFAGAFDYAKNALYENGAALLGVMTPLQALQADADKTAETYKILSDQVKEQTKGLEANTEATKAQRAAEQFDLAKQRIQDAKEFSTALDALAIVRESNTSATVAAAAAEVRWLEMNKEDAVTLLGAAGAALALVSAKHRLTRATQEDADADANQAIGQQRSIATARALAAARLADPIMDPGYLAAQARLVAITDEINQKGETKARLDEKQAAEAGLVVAGEQALTAVRLQQVDAINQLEIRQRALVLIQTQHIDQGKAMKLATDEQRESQIQQALATARQKGESEQYIAELEILLRLQGQVTDAGQGLIDGQQKAQTQAQLTADVMNFAFGQIGSTLSGAYGQLLLYSRAQEELKALSKETADEAAAGQAAAVQSFLAMVAQQALAQSFQALGTGFLGVALGDPVKAAAGFTAAGIFAAIAAGGGIGAGAIGVTRGNTQAEDQQLAQARKSSSTSSTVTGTGSSSRSSGSSSKTGGEKTYVINVIAGGGLLPAQSDVDRSIRVAMAYGARLT